MARYIKKLSTLGSLGPSEEQGRGLWVGYDIEGVDRDLSSDGLFRADEMTADELAARGITSFSAVSPARLGLGETDEY